MTKIAFLGIGAMGSRMAQKLVAAGHTLNVWNRTAERTRDLATAGANAVKSPREAAEGADFVFSMVRDDAASSAVWLDRQNGALAGMHPGAIGVECSTLTVSHVHELAAAFNDAGLDFLDAPLAGSRPQAEAGQLIFLVGGAVGSLAKIRPLLDVMGGAVHHAGENGAGTVVKLMINALFGTQLAVMGELIGFARRAGINTEKAVEIIGSTPVCSPAVKLSSGAMLAGNFAPAFPIDLVAKDFGLMDASAKAISADVPLSRATGDIFRAAKKEGFGGDNITGIVQRYNGRN